MTARPHAALSRPRPWPHSALCIATAAFVVASSCKDAANDHTTDEDMGRATAGDAVDANDTPDAAPAPDATPTVFDTTVISAPSEEWTWVEFPEAKCGNGAPAGIGVNLTARSDDVFVYFMGGGACWDVNSCFVLNAAVNIESGYGQARFESDPQLDATAFSRDEADNPLRDMSWVFVPYCTGDLHAGTRPNTYSALGQTRQVHHVGGTNVEHFLGRLAPTFSDAPHVYVSGSSAGGYAAQLNAHRFIDAFGEAEVHVLSDSAPLLQPYAGRISAWNAAWAMEPPTGCVDCATNFPAWFDHLAATYPASRFGLLSWDADQTIHLYFGYPADGSFVNAMNSFVSNHMGPPANAQTFLLSGTQHVMLNQLMTMQHPNGPSLRDWVQSWIDGTDWSDALPQ